VHLKSKAVNNKELLLELSKRLGKTQKEISNMLEATSEAIVANLKTGNVVSIQGFGNFEPRAKQEREIVNPTTKEVIKVPAKVSINFKAGTIYKEKIKNITQRGK
jgi:DNA-binding protein HU-beta